MKKCFSCLLALTLILSAVPFSSVFVADAAAYSYDSINTGLPVINIIVEGGVQAGQIDKDNKRNATFVIRSSPQSSQNITTPAVMTIKARGNSSYTSMPKHSFKIKFDKKQNLCGLGSAKEWCLLANWTDKTMMHNYLAFTLGKAMGDGYTPDCHFAELFINGIYQGNYLITEQIEIKDQRIVLDNPDATGYLLEVDSWQTEINRFTSAHNVAFAIKSPDEEELTPEQKSYISNHINTVETALYSGTKSYLNYIDVPSFIDWYIVNEFFRNTDSAFFSSCYMYMAEGGKLYMGPLWDFDLSSGIVGYDLGANGAAGFKTREAAWFQQLFRDSDFAFDVKVRWTEIRNTLIDQWINQKIDATAAYLHDSQIADTSVWPMNQHVDWQQYTPKATYALENAYMKQFLTNRANWMDTQYYIYPAELVSKINVLPAGITLADKTQVGELLKAYVGLKESEKSQVSNYSVLKSASDAIFALENPMTIASVQLSGGETAGKMITASAIVVNGTQSDEYKFDLYFNSVLIKSGHFSSLSTMRFTAFEPGDYYVRLSVRNPYGSADTKDSGIISTAPAPDITASKTGVLNPASDPQVTFTCGLDDPDYTYTCIISKDGKLCYTSILPQNHVSYFPRRPGDYTVYFACTNTLGETVTFSKVFTYSIVS